MTTAEPPKRSTVADAQPENPETREMETETSATAMRASHRPAEQRLGDADTKQADGIAVDKINGEIDLVELMIAVARNQKLIMQVTLGAVVVASLVALLLPATYRATATILPPQRSPSLASSILGQMGALTGLAGKDISLK